MGAKLKCVYVFEMHLKRGAKKGKVKGRGRQRGRGEGELLFTGTVSYFLKLLY